MGAAWLEGAGDGDDADSGGPRAHQYAGTLSGCGARGEHVVYKNDMAAGDHLGPSHGEGVADIPPASDGVQIGLGQGRHVPEEHIGGYRDIPGALEPEGQEQGLIVASLARAASVERHRHEDIGHGAR